jgi:hypothetical protein
MPLKGIAKVRKNYRVAVEKIAVGTTDRALYAILSQGGAMADTMTPIDTSNLINSRTAPQIEPSATGMKGRVGYTAHYAAAVHEATGKLKGKPRPRNRGNYWDPNAEPQFLEKGFEAIKPSIPIILKRVYGA